MPKWFIRMLVLYLPTFGIAGIIKFAIWDAEVFKGMPLIEIFSHPLHWLLIAAMVAFVLGIIWLFLRHDTDDDMEEIKDKLDRLTDTLTELITEIRKDRESRNGKRT